MELTDIDPGLRLILAGLLFGAGLFFLITNGFYYKKWWVRTLYYLLAIVFWVASGAVGCSTADGQTADSLLFAQDMEDSPVAEAAVVPAAEASSPLLRVLEAKTSNLSSYTLVTGAISYNGPVNQTYVVFGLPSGFSAVLWSSLGADNARLGDDFDDEFDIIGCYSRQVSGVNVDGCVGVFLIARSAADLDGHVGFAGLKFSRTFGPTDVFVSADTYVPTRRSTPGAGTLMWLGQTTTISPTNWIEFDLTTKILYDRGAFDGERGIVWQPQTEVRLGSRAWQGFAGFNGFVPRDGADIDRDARGVFTIGIKLTPGRGD